MVTLIGLDMISYFVWYVADIYSSNRIDWQPLESEIGIFDAFLAFIGKQMY